MAPNLSRMSQLGLPTKLSYIFQIGYTIKHFYMINDHVIIEKLDWNFL